jgi:hypothetical protein
MTEAQWLNGEEPRQLLEHVEVHQHAARTRSGRRKLRLFACACCRRIWHLLPGEPHRRCVELSERFADGQIDKDEFQRQADAVRSQLFAGSWVSDAVRAALEERPQDATWAPLFAAWAAGTGPNRDDERAQCDLVRELFGNPFRPVAVDPAWLTWNRGLVVDLARSIARAGAYERLPVLADALEDAGCDNTDLLTHLRGPNGHVRGCWALDLLIVES